MKNLRDRTAVVTGAASGIGRALAARLIAEGMNVTLADVDEAALTDAVHQLGDRARAVKTDISDAASVELLAERTLAEFGGVHLLCNVAGVESGGRFSEIPLETWRWVLDVNVMGTVHCCRTFLPILRREESAHIVNTASIAAFSSRTPTFAPYIASKSAVLGLTESLAIEERAAGSTVGVSLLVPGPTRTRMIDAERNRPENVPSTMSDPDRSAVAASLQAVTAQIGIDPSETALHVVEAVQADRFYVLTHPEAAFTGLRNRDEWMRGGDAPVPAVVGGELRRPNRA
jgi:NAD(P)-dependent dehydrogenase (short-subunit alcohol dehydrogenase family)